MERALRIEAAARASVLCSCNMMSVSPGALSRPCSTRVRAIGAAFTVPPATLHACCIDSNSGDARRSEQVGDTTAAAALGSGKSLYCMVTGWALVPLTAPILGGSRASSEPQGQLLGELPPAMKAMRNGSSRTVCMPAQQPPSVL